ncbi:MAG: response regulator [Candidatus Saganbacteria bacterium]|nr:response regulator [Candidatus Saganbacteria bacterium]
MNKILLIEDDPRVASLIKEVLSDCEIIESKALDEAKAIIREKSPDLLILDCDLRGLDAFSIFKILRSSYPDLPSIMLSGSGEVALAVSAARLGVIDFLRKPLEREKLKESVGNALAPSAFTGAFDIESMENFEWADGESRVISQFIFNLEEAAVSGKDVLLLGEEGIPKETVSLAIHANSKLKKRKWTSLSLSSFKKEASEGHFWIALQEFLQEGRGERDESDLYGTINLKEFEGLSDHFRESILRYLNERKSDNFLGKVDRSIRVTVEASDLSNLSGFEGMGLLDHFARIDVPKLRERKEDIPLIAAAYIEKFSAELGKNVRNISTEALKFIVSYDWPGNYNELRNVILVAVLNTAGESVGIKDIPISFKMLLSGPIKKIAKGPVRLESLRQQFERELYGKVLEKTSFDEGRSALLLNIPKSFFASRIKELGLRGEE